MPQFTWSTAMTANQLGLNPRSGWQYEYLPWPAQVLLLIRSTTAGNRITVFTGSETIQERTPVQAGGTAGVTPSELNTQRLAFRQQLEIASNWSLTRYSRVLQRWMASLSSTPSSRSYKQLRLRFGPLQRDQHRSVEPIRPEAHGHEGTTARSPAGQRDRALPPDLLRRRKSVLGIVEPLRSPYSSGRDRGQRLGD